MDPASSATRGENCMQSTDSLGRLIAAASDLHRRTRAARASVLDYGFSAMRQSLDQLAEALEFYSEALSARSAGIAIRRPATGAVRAHEFDRDWEGQISGVTTALAGFADAVQAESRTAAAHADADTAALLSEFWRILDYHLWLVVSHYAPLSRGLDLTARLAPKFPDPGRCLPPSIRSRYFCRA